MYEKLSIEFKKMEIEKNVRKVINISHDSDLATRVINLYGMVTSLH